MRTRTAVSVAAGLLACTLGLPAAFADSADADCVFRRDGETKEGKSGPCSFSQRQGYVDIDLRNGSTYSLSPGDQANHYRDQEGKKVVRTVHGDGAHEYKWEGKKIIVRFPQGHGGGHHGAAAAHDVPQDLSDLPHGRYVGGEVDDEMVRRGYKHVRNDAAGDDLWSYWHSKGGGQCVVVHMDAQRRVSSVVNAPSTDCKK